MERWFNTLSKKLAAITKKNSEDVQQADLIKSAQKNLDPRTSKPIIEAVLQSEEFSVTIDSSLSINWLTKNGRKNYPKNFSVVTSKAQLLSVQIDQLFARKINRYRYKRIIAEALALALDQNDTNSALPLLDELEVTIGKHGRERVRFAYIFYAAITTIIVGVLAAVFIHYKNASWLFGGNKHLYEMCVTTIAGGIGAFVSTFFRFKNYKGNINAGLSMHRLDGFLRIMYGCITAFILGLAIYSNTILGFLNTLSGQWVIYLLAALAGTSEFRIPNLVKGVETGEDAEKMTAVQKEVKDDIDKNEQSEEMNPLYISEEYEDKSIIEPQLDEETVVQEEGSYDDKLPVDTISNEDHVFPQQNEYFDEVEEDQQADKNELMGEPVAFVIPKKNEDEVPSLNQIRQPAETSAGQHVYVIKPPEEIIVMEEEDEIETSNTEDEQDEELSKLQKEIKRGQLVQGKMNLQD